MTSLPRTMRALALCAAGARFAAISARHGYWLATPEENAAVGIQMGF